jgi:SAM-dependent methyltransferase
MLWNGTECPDRSAFVHPIRFLPSHPVTPPVSDQLASYYNRLSRWTRVAHLLGYGGGHAALTVHRALADPAADGRTTSTRLHDLLIELLPPLTTARVLDAGCGFGGTMIDLAARTGGSYLGVTLSATQRDAGVRAIARAGLADRVSILVQSYDQPPPGPYDVILAIESLAHSRDPGNSVAALAHVLAPGGTLAIVDDMPDPAALDTAELHAFKTGWQAPVLSSVADFQTAFADSGLSLTLDRDLSALCRPRALDRIRQLERLNRMLRRAVPLMPWRALMDSYGGGLALERLYRQGIVRYRLLMARRQ